VLMGGRGLAGVGIRLSSFCCTRATRVIFLKYHAKNELVTESRIKIEKKTKKNTFTITTTKQGIKTSFQKMNNKYSLIRSITTGTIECKR
jgi:hypothetical protein